MKNLKTTEKNLDKKFRALFDRLINLKMYDDANDLNQLYYDTKTNAYNRSTEFALRIMNNNKKI